MLFFILIIVAFLIRPPQAFSLVSWEAIAEEPTETSVSFSQEENASEPMDVTVEGIWARTK